jgi:N utilization substance protein A
MCDWIVDVKTQEDFESMDIFEQARSAAEAAFDIPEEAETANAEPVIEYTSDTEDGIPLSDLPLDKEIIRKLEVHDILTVEEFLEYSDEELADMGDLSADEIQTINNVIRENIDIVEDEDAVEEAGFVCPNCGHPIEEGMTECPNCHVGISFESAEDDQE